MVAIFAGTLYIERVVSSHVHLLQKEALACDYIVADLDDLGMSSNGNGIKLCDDDIGMTNLSSINSIEAPPLPSSLNQLYDDRGYSSIHTDQIAITCPTESDSEHLSSTAYGESTIFYRRNGGRSGMNRTLSQAQRRELTSLGLM